MDDIDGVLKLELVSVQKVISYRAAQLVHLDAVHHAGAFIVNKRIGRLAAVGFDELDAGVWPFAGEQDENLAVDEQGAADDALQVIKTEPALEIEAVLGAVPDIVGGLVPFWV